MKLEAETTLLDDELLKEDVENAGQNATKYITDLTDGIMVHPEDDDTTGWKIKDSLELLVSGVSHIWAGIQNAVALVRIGLANAGNIVLSGEGYVDVRHGSEVVAHFGYGEGNSEGDIKQQKPYYTIGYRKPVQSSEDIGNYSVAEGYNITASGYGSHAEGYNTTASGSYSHAEGYNTTASGSHSHAEGSSTTASGNYARAEGYNTTASGSYSHAEGCNTKAPGYGSHAEGVDTKATDAYAHAEGNDTTASASSSHAEGADTTASGNYAHAEGWGTTASGYGSHAGGYNTIASGMFQTVIGRGNVAYNDTYVFIIGNGSSEARSNALTVDWSGNLRYKGTASSMSDLKRKIVDEDHDWKVDEFIRGLKPIAYELVQDDKTLSRKRMGFGAQDVAELVERLGIGDLAVYEAIDKFGQLYIPTEDEKIDDKDISWTLCYTDFIAPMVLEIQRLMDRVDELERKLGDKNA